jgi:hypothetical protein
LVNQSADSEYDNFLLLGLRRPRSLKNRVTGGKSFLQKKNFFISTYEKAYRSAYEEPFLKTFRKFLKARTWKYAKATVKQNAVITWNANIYSRNSVVPKVFGNLLIFSP